ncbi:acylphosphatase [Clostridium sp. AF19-22AC]|jgi:acylphosphatase|uniref:acylphosphatase n=1 Tax=Faecalicatena orotica TaxID=1544 RepID=A0A2Y9BA03_9FIRM|nr:MULTISPECIES: acylphosphatase [Clostridia]PWJ31494.1 acylphosphatase [Faecalicatena orotica]RHR25061.1 acylphosphatase [Clostridium sp. AF19-22AC]SSA54701.1 acylphosphatase [Faecalicatena orotica]
MAEVRKHITFYGRVQGVGFRYTAKYLAQSLQLTGWVKNEWDGTVTMEVQGREPMINKLLVGLNQGSFISIEWMDTKEIPLEKESSFYVR